MEREGGVFFILKKLVQTQNSMKVDKNWEASQSKVRRSVQYVKRERSITRSHSSACSGLKFNNDFDDMPYICRTCFILVQSGPAPHIKHR